MEVKGGGIVVVVVVWVDVDVEDGDDVREDVGLVVRWGGEFECKWNVRVGKRVEDDVEIWVGDGGCEEVKGVMGVNSGEEWNRVGGRLDRVGGREWGDVVGEVEGMREFKVSDVLGGGGKEVWGDRREGEVGRVGGKRIVGCNGVGDRK